MRREPNGGNRNGGNQVAGMPERGAGDDRPVGPTVRSPGGRLRPQSFPPLPHTFPPFLFPPFPHVPASPFPPFPLDIPRPGRQSLYGRLRGCFISWRSLAGKASLGCAFPLSCGSP